MNSLRNSVRLIGHIGMKPEVKNFDSGKKVVRMALATNEIYKNHKGEKVEETCWHNLVIWGKTAEFVEKYLDKGREIAIEGKLTSRSYTSKDGQKKYISEIIVNDLITLGKKP